MSQFDAKWQEEMFKQNQAAGLAMGLVSRQIPELPDADWELADRIAKQIKDEHMSPEGTLGLSKLLDERRLQYGIPDEAFEEQASFDRCYVHQIQPRWLEGGKGKKIGSLYLPESSQKRRRVESSRGVLVSAGLVAMDSLRSNGIELGHIVNIVRMNPWRKYIGMVGSHELDIMVLRDGDIVGSEDVRAQLKSGETRVEWDEAAGCHFYVDTSGKRWKPKMPVIDDSI